MPTGPEGRGDREKHKEAWDWLGQALGWAGVGRLAERFDFDRVGAGQANHDNRSTRGDSLGRGVHGLQLHDPVLGSEIPM